SVLGMDAERNKRSRKKRQRDQGPALIRRTHDMCLLAAPVVAPTRIGRRSGTEISPGWAAGRLRPSSRALRQSLFAARRPPDARGAFAEVAAKGGGEVGGMAIADLLGDELDGTVG